jgi:ABC-2 type transport system ATP-binding protein
VAIQRCLKEYNATRGVTMLLTSHYMRDVEALCSRVLVIASGKVIYDGPLSGIVEKFGREKIVRLHFEGEETPVDLGRFGEYTSNGPEAELKVDRARVAETIAAILDHYTVIDLSVQDPPLDKMIARVFEQGERGESVDALPEIEDDDRAGAIAAKWKADASRPEDDGVQTTPPDGEDQIHAAG